MALTFPLSKRTWLLLCKKLRCTIIKTRPLVTFPQKIKTISNFLYKQTFSPYFLSNWEESVFCGEPAKINYSFQLFRSSKLWILNFQKLRILNFNTPSSRIVCHFRRKKIVPNYMSLYNTNEILILFFLLYS